MADELGNTTTVPTPTTDSTAAPSIPDDYEALRAKAAEYDSLRPALEQIAPYYDEFIKPIVEDEERRNYTKMAWEARKRQLEAAEPELTPELRAFEKRMEARYGPVADFIRQQDENNKRYEAEQNKRAYDENVSYGLRLKAEHPELMENNNFGMWSLIQAAEANKISLEEAFKRFGSAFTRPDPGVPKKDAKNYTSGLHGTGQPGIPGESKPVERPRTRAGMTQHIAAQLRAGMKG